MTDKADRTAWYEWWATGMLERYELTDRDLRYLRHFWEEYRDLSRYMEFSHMGKQLCRYRPDIVRAWEEWLPAQKALNAWLGTLGYAKWEEENRDPARAKAVWECLLRSKHGEQFTELVKEYLYRESRLTQILETIKYRNE